MGDPRVQPEALTNVWENPRVLGTPMSVRRAFCSAHRSDDGAGRARGGRAGAAAGRAARGEQVDVGAGTAEGGRDGELRGADAVLEGGSGGELYGKLLGVEGRANPLEMLTCGPLEWERTHRLRGFKILSSPKARATGKVTMSLWPTAVRFGCGACLLTTGSAIEAIERASTPTC